VLTIVQGHLSRENVKQAGTLSSAPILGASP